jgi:hypothetical protein
LFLSVWRLDVPSWILDALAYARAGDAYVRGHVSLAALICGVSVTTINNLPVGGETDCLLLDDAKIVKVS